MAIMATNASFTMIPLGGKTPFFSTPPWSFAAPRAGAPPVIDRSSSATAFVNLAQVAAAAEAVPRTLALDAAEGPTTGAVAGRAGSIAPVGRLREAAFALMVKVLAAGLTGANLSFVASSMSDDESGPPQLGQTIIMIRAGGFDQGNPVGRLDTLLTVMTVEEGT